VRVARSLLPHPRTDRRRSVVPACRTLRARVAPTASPAECLPRSLHGAKVGFGSVGQLRMEELLSENRFGRPGARQLDQPVPTNSSFPRLHSRPGPERVSLEELPTGLCFALPAGSRNLQTHFLCGQPHGSCWLRWSATGRLRGAPSQRAVIAQPNGANLKATRAEPDAEPIHPPLHPGRRGTAEVGKQQNPCKILGTGTG